MSRKKSTDAKIAATPVAAADEPAILEQRILILAPTWNDSQLTAGFLTRAKLSAKVCRDVPQLCHEVLKGCGAILLAEETLAESSISVLVKTLAVQPSWSDTPIVLITSGGEVSQTRLRRLAIFGPGGNVTLLERPFRPATLTSAIEVALRSRQRQYEVRRLMEDLSDARVRMEATLNAADVGTWVWDVRKNRVVADRNLARLFSLSLDNFTEGPVEKFIAAIHQEDQARVKAAIAATLESNKNELEIDYRVAQTDGSVRWVTARGKVERDATGKPVRFPGVVIDITERTRQQNEMVALARQIEDQALIFNTTLSYINDFAYIFDLNGRFRYVNKPLLDLWGLTLEQAVGKNFFELNYPGELAEKLQRQIEQVIITKTSLRDTTPYTSASGSKGFYEYIFNPVLMPDGRVEMVAGSTRDITEYKRQQAELLEASRAKDEFLAALSHELRTPLNPALLIASESADNHSLPEEVRLNFEIIRKNIELEARLIDDLLDLTRITTGKMVLNRDVTDVHDILVDALATVQADQQEKGILLAVKLKAKPSLVYGDAVRLQQIFWNVLKNAVKFTPAKGQITVETSNCIHNHLLITITDTGIGMTADETSRIFSAFAQGNHARRGGSHQVGGLGLGLAISKNLLELHSGNITAQSAGSGRGSVFTIELPLAEATKMEDKTESVAKANKPLVLEVNRRPFSILLVEDHEITRKVLAHLLTRRKYKVATADSVASARQLARQGNFDVLISDIGLPDGNGNDLMKELKETYGLKGIALTGYGMEEDISRGKVAGFVTHLIKPVRVESLERALEMLKSENDN